MRVLIIRLSALGDIVHALPLAENARRAGATVGWACEDRFRVLLEDNPNIDELFVADTRRWRRNPVATGVRRQLRDLTDALAAFAPDWTIDAQGLWKSAFLARAARAPVAAFSFRERREPGSALLADHLVRPPEGVRHIVDKNLALLAPTGIPVRRRAPDARYLLARKDPVAAAFVTEQPAPYAVFHPGAGRPEKVWGADRLATVARKLQDERGLSPVISWGPGDEPLAERMTKKLPEARRVPPLSLRGLARVVAGASLFVGGDTGPLHLADALGAPTLGLFGPHDRGRNEPSRNGPYRGTAVRYTASTSPDEVVRRALDVLERRRDPA
jgi:heptosyltransferase I